jgi:hypothetical protein
MSTSPEPILYEAGPIFITKEKIGRAEYFLIWRNRATAAVRIGTIGCALPGAWARAKNLADIHAKKAVA